jgi:hypothetical protein
MPLSQKSLQCPSECRTRPRCSCRLGGPELLVRPGYAELDPVRLVSGSLISRIHSESRSMRQPKPDTSVSTQSPSSSIV